MEDSEKKSLIQQYIASYNDFDIDGMMSVLNPDIEFVNISNEEVTTKTSGLEELRTLAEQSKALFSSRTQTVRSMDVREPITTVEISFTAVLAVDLPNGLEAGQAVELNGVSEFQFKNGKISSIVDKS